MNLPRVVKRDERLAAYRMLLGLFDVRAGQRAPRLRHYVDRTDAALRQENRA
jgi:hypothetical protein